MDRKCTVNVSFLIDLRFNLILPLILGSRVDGLAFDKESRLLYYTDTTHHTIGIYNPDGSFHKLLVKAAVLNPRAIVLDPTNG